MANWTTVNDILVDALFKSGNTTTDTTDEFYLQGLRYVNDINMDLHAGNGPLDADTAVIFRWALKDPSSALILQPKFATGTVSVTNGSATATLSAATATDLTDYFLILDDETDVFRIQAHTPTSDTLTLDAVWSGDTDATATYKAVKTIYSVGSSDIMHLAEPFRTYELGTEGEPYQITSMGLSQFDTSFPVSKIRAGTPTKFKVISESDGTLEIQFNKYMETDNLKVEYDYVAIPTDLVVGNTPAVPRQYRKIMSDWAAALLLQDKNDNKSAAFFQLAQSRFKAMVKSHKLNSHRSSSRMGKVIPRRDQASRRSYRRTTEVTYSS